MRVVTYFSWALGPVEIIEDDGKQEERSDAVGAAKTKAKTKAAQKERK